MEHWRPYLQQDEFVIRTDQRSLVHLEDQQLTTPWQQKVMTKLLGLQYRLCTKRVKNRATDAPSRKVSRNDGGLIAVSTCIPAWLTELAAGYKEDVQTSRLLIALSVGNSKHLKL